MKGYTDSDWGPDRRDRRSISGNIFLLNRAPISWQGKKHQTVSLSSTEAEYQAAALATQEAIWLRRLLEDLGFVQNDATLLYEDNEGCISLSKDATNHARTKHIDVKHHFIREKVETKQIALSYVHTTENRADILTKGLPRVKFEYLRSDLVVDCQLSGSVENRQSSSQLKMSG